VGKTSLIAVLQRREGLAAIGDLEFCSGEELNFQSEKLEINTSESERTKRPALTFEYLDHMMAGKGVFTFTPFAH
jgi:hypothetical protein